MEEENSQLAVKLLIKGKGFEISTEGKTSDLYKELDTLSQFADAVSQKLGMKCEPAQTHDSNVSPGETAVNVAEMPLITPSKNIIDNIKALFDTPWGKTPRKNAEVSKALEVNALPVDNNQMSKYLTRQVHKGNLRRIEKDGQYHYYKVPQQPNPKEN